MLKWALASSPVAAEDLKLAVDTAAPNGDLQSIKELHEHGAALTENVFVHAASNGYLEVLQWAVAHGCPYYQHSTRFAVEGGQAAVLKWLHEDLGLTLEPWAVSDAAKAGSLAAVQYLCDLGCQLPETALDDASHGGSTDLLLWLLARGYTFTEETSMSAAEGGHMDTLRWLRERGCPIDYEVIVSAAASGGNIGMLSLLLNEGYDLHPGAPLGAANNNRLAALRYVAEQGAPIDWEEIGEMAAANSEDLMFDWLLQRKPPHAWQPAELTRMLAVAAWNGNSSAAEWLLFEVDALWPDVLEYDGMPWPVHMVQW
jgi:hypothetical protein